VPRLKVTRIDALTPRIRRIEVENADGGELPAFTAGAHIDVDLGMGEARSYSLLNDAAERNRYVLGVLREEAGLGGSAWVHEQLKVGDVLTSTPPSNDFPLDEEGRHHILIAGGIGITPIMAMAARLASIGHEFTLHYCARSAAEAAFLEELTERYGARLRTYFDGGDPSVGIAACRALARRPRLCLRSHGPHSRCPRGGKGLADRYGALRVVQGQRERYRPGIERPALRDRAQANQPDIHGTGRQDDPTGAQGGGRQDQDALHPWNLRHLPGRSHFRKSRSSR
jgi:hypothetical protein